MLLHMILLKDMYEKHVGMLHICMKYALYICIY